MRESFKASMGKHCKRPDTIIYELRLPFPVAPSLTERADELHAWSVVREKPRERSNQPGPCGEGEWPRLGTSPLPLPLSAGPQFPGAPGPYLEKQDWEP